MDFYECIVETLSGSCVQVKCRGNLEYAKRVYSTLTNTVILFSYRDIVLTSSLSFREVADLLSELTGVSYEDGFCTFYLCAPAGTIDNEVLEDLNSIGVCVHLF